MTDAEWASVRVAVASSHMARTQSLAAQFYARYFGVDIALNERFIVAEGIFEEDALVRLLNDHATDYGIGRVAFRSLYRMHDGTWVSMSVLSPCLFVCCRRCVLHPNRERVDLLCHAASVALDEVMPGLQSTSSVQAAAATTRAIQRTGCRSPSIYDEPQAVSSLVNATGGILALCGLVLASVATGVVMALQTRARHTLKPGQAVGMLASPTPASPQYTHELCAAAPSDATTQQDSGGGATNDATVDGLGTLRGEHEVASQDVVVHTVSDVEDVKHGPP